MICFSIYCFKMLLIRLWRFFHQFFFWKLPLLFVNLYINRSLLIIGFKYWVGSSWSDHWGSWLVSNYFHGMRAGVVFLLLFVAALFLYRSGVNNHFLNNPWLPFWLQRLLVCLRSWILFLLLTFNRCASANDRRGWLWKLAKTVPVLDIVGVDLARNFTHFYLNIKLK